MRRWTLSLGMAGALVTCLAIGGAGSAAAATLSYTGTLSFTIGNPPSIGSNLPSVSGIGTGVYVGPVHISTIGFAAGQFGPITTSVPVTSSNTINSIRFTGLANMTGTFTGLSGGPPGGGSMGLSGMAKVCLIFDPCTYAQITVPFTPVGGIGVGVGGTQYVTGGVTLAMQHAPWTVGQPVMTIHTAGTSVTTPPLPGGYASPPSATAANSGVLQLVTATKVSTSLTGAFPELPLFSILNLHFFGGATPTPTPHGIPTPPPHGTPSPTPHPHGTPSPTPWAHGTPTPTPNPHGIPTPPPHGTPASTPGPHGIPMPPPHGTPASIPGPHGTPTPTPTPHGGGGVAWLLGMWI